MTLFERKHKDWFEKFGKEIPDRFNLSRLSFMEACYAQKKDYEKSLHETRVAKARYHELIKTHGGLPDRLEEAEKLIIELSEKYENRNRSIHSSIELVQKAKEYVTKWRTK